MDYGQIIYMVLKGSLIASVLIGLVFILRLAIRKKVSPSITYYIWLIVLVKLLVPYGPESSFSIYNLVNERTSVIQNSFTNDLSNEQNINNSLNSSTESNSSISNEASNSNTTQKLSEDKKITKKEIMFFGWALVAIALILYSISAYIYLNIRISRSKRKVSDKLRQSLSICLNEMNIKRTPELIVTGYINTPSLIGIVSPKILIPEELINKLEESDLRYILLHELCHLRRGDIIITWMASIVKALHWFNPFVYLAIRTMQNDCEVSCDNKVLNYLEDKENVSYGNTIINVLRYMSKPKYLPGTTAMVASKTTIKERVRMISKNKKFTLGSIVIGISLIIGIAIVTLTSSKPQNLEEQLNATAKAYLRGMIGKVTETRENSTLGFLDKPENYSYEQMLDSFYKINFIDVKEIKEISSREAYGTIYYSYLENKNSENTRTHGIDTIFMKVNGKWKISQFETGLMSDKPVTLFDELKEPASELFSNFVISKGYKIIINSGWLSKITLPKDFSTVVNGVKVGEILKERNEISKSYGFDFTSYLGKSVIFNSLAIENDKLNSEAVGLFYNGEMIAFWTHEYGAKNESDIGNISVKLELKTTGKEPVTDDKTYKIYSTDINTDKEVILSTLDVDSSVTKLEDKLQNLASYLSQVKFASLPIELVKIEDVDGNKIATFNLVEAPINKNIDNWNNYVGESWFKFSGGSAGGRNTSYSLIKTLLQPEYSGEWIDGVVFQYKGSDISFGHVENLNRISYRNEIR